MSSFLHQKSRSRAEHPHNSVDFSLQKYEYIHIYTYMPTYIHAYIHTYIHTYIPTYVHTYIHTYLLTYIPKTKGFEPPIWGLEAHLY